MQNLNVKAVFSSQYETVSFLRDVDVASRVASVLAVQGAPASLLSTPPKAHLTLIIEELPLNDNAVTVHGSQLPGASSRSATVASLLTGQPAAVHGIVGDAWFARGKTMQNAYESAAEFPLVSQLQDVIALTNEMNGARQAVSISASSSRMLARALGVRPELRLRLGESVAVVDIVAGAFAATPVSSALSAEEVRALIVAEFPDHSVSHHQAFQALYGELAFGVNVLSGVAAAKRPMTDGALDSISLGVQGLAAVRRSFGAQSAEFASALALVKSALRRFEKLAADAYGSSAAVSSVVISINAGVEAEIALPEGLPVNAVALPHLYVTEQNRATACALLDIAGIASDCFSASKRAVMAPDAVPTAAAPVDPPVAVPVAIPVAAPANVSAPANVTAPVNSTAPVAPPSPVSADEVAMFQVILWASILMTAVILAVIISFCNMDVGEDSLLYRTTAIPTRPVASHHAAK